MGVSELSREQLIQLKQNYLMMNEDSVSWEELMRADDLVSDKIIMDEYSRFIFSEDDF